MVVVRTVLGDISPKELGAVLPHEHTFFHWLGAESDHRSSYDREEVLQAVASELKRVKEAHGVSGLVDVTTSDAGRNVEFMAELSRRSGVHIVAATGFYTQSMGIPYYWRVRPIDALEEFFAREIAEGVIGTDTKCGVIKLASGPELGKPLPALGAEVDDSAGRPAPHEERAFKAAARVQKRLGVAITTHTDPYDWAIGNIGAGQLDLLEEGGADLSRCIIGHAEGNRDISQLVEILKRGANVGIDTIGYVSRSLNDGIRLGLVTALVTMGYAGQLLLSHDRVLFEMRCPPTERDPRRYNGQNLGKLFEEFIPGLLNSGVSEEVIHQITVENPQRIFAF
ncbi:MAG: phosphotriesterase [Dehalococcoidia bacterium]